MSGLSEAPSFEFRQKWEIRLDKARVKARYVSICYNKVKGNI